MHTAEPTKTEAEKLKELDELIQTLWSSSESAFYKEIWKKQPPRITSRDDLLHIPSCSWETFILYPLHQRTYSGEPGLFSKLVYRNNEPLLVGRTFSDIAREHYGISADRPLLLFASQHEMLEKSIWQYEHNRLPLLCNPNAEITAALAQRYETDCVVCDSAGLKTYLPALVQTYDRTYIKDIVVIDTSFDPSFLRKQFPDSTIHCVFAPPEIGTVGVAQCDKNSEELSFSIDPHTIVEIDDSNTLIVSRTLALPTPVIRYKTEHKAQWNNVQHTDFSLQST